MDSCYFGSNIAQIVPFKSCATQQSTGQSCRSKAAQQLLSSSHAAGAEVFIRSPCKWRFQTNKLRSSSLHKGSDVCFIIFCSDSSNMVTHEFNSSTTPTVGWTTPTVGWHYLLDLERSPCTSRITRALSSVRGASMSGGVLADLLAHCWLLF